MWWTLFEALGMCIQGIGGAWEGGASNVSPQGLPWLPTLGPFKGWNPFICQNVVLLLPPTNPRKAQPWGAGDMKGGLTMPWAIRDHYYGHTDLEGDFPVGYGQAAAIFYCKFSKTWTSLRWVSSGRDGDGENYIWYTLKTPSWWKRPFHLHLEIH